MLKAFVICLFLSVLVASAISASSLKRGALQEEHAHDPIHEIIHLFDANEDELLQPEEFDELYANFAGTTTSDHAHAHKKRALDNPQAKRSLMGIQQTNDTAHCESADVLFEELSEASGSLNESTTQVAVNEMFLMRLEGCFAVASEELPPCGERVQESWLYGIISAVGISALSFLGVLLLPLKKGTKSGAIMFRMLIGFASGSIIGDAVMHILPEVFGVHGHGGGAETGPVDHMAEKLAYLIPAVVVCGSVVFFFIMEKVITKLSGHSHSHGFESDHEEDEDSDHHKHTRDEEDPEKKHAHSETSSEGEHSEHSHSHHSHGKHDHHHDKKAYLKSIKPYGWLNLAADAIHNFTDGLALGAAWATSNSVGLATTLAVLFHEIPQELGDYALLRRAGFRRLHALLFNFASAVTAIIGTIIGLAVGHSDADKWILAITGGGFLYIGMSELLPELNKEKVKFVWVIQQLAGLLLGFVALFLIAYYETETECIPSAQV